MSNCTLLQKLYDPADAHIRAEKSISEARTGILTDEATIARINAIITPLVKNGQSLHQIYLDHVDELMCSEKTLYNYVDAQLFDVRNIDLPRKVKYRPRYKKPEFKVDRGCRIGRSYQDFLKFMETEPETHIVQMDSVIGKVGGKCLPYNPLRGYQSDVGFPSRCEYLAISYRYIQPSGLRPGHRSLWKLFPVILTDNGSEFSNPKEIEYRENFGESHSLMRTRVYYCDPSSPYQKGSCEVNHELIRRILPKGSSFDDLTQEDVIRMMNHINSYKRKKLNDRTPYDSFSFLYGEEVLKKLGCSKVAAENIILKPKLLKEVTIFRHGRQRKTQLKHLK